MYSTQVYSYIPRQIVVLYDGTSSRRYQTVYAKNLKLHKGVDNKLQFQFINQEEKPVDISNKEITFRFISYDGTTVLVKKTLSLLLPLTGIAQLELGSADIEDIDPQNGYYSLELPSDIPVFVDSDSGARGKMSIVDSILPSFVTSMEFNPNASGNTTTFYSSTIDTSDNSIVTFQTQYSEYSGNVTFQGSTTGSEWYTIETMSLAVGDIANAVTGTFGNSFVGFHPFMRVQFDKVNGNVVGNILVR